MEKKNKKTTVASVIAALIGAVLYAFFGIQLPGTETVPTTTEPVQTEVTAPVQQETAVSTAEVSNVFYADTKLEIPAKLTERREQVLNRVNYTVSYNSTWNLPNWVAWDITREELADNYQRSDTFVPDPNLSTSRAVTTEDYIGSGYDRGHMCPAGDNHFDSQAMDECFYMTNICPQDHELNKGAWNDLEMACRRWARRYGKVYVVCGPIVSSDNSKRIGRRHKVTVPDAFFKVIFVANAHTPQAIGYIFQNNSSGKPYKAYSVDEIESITGIDFFPALPDEIENAVEATFDESFWKWGN